MLNTEQGRESMSFFQGLMQNDDNMFVFEHARTVSGNTIDAMPAMMTGCLPLTDEGLKSFTHAHGKSIGCEFYNNGYPTASFSSRAIDNTIKGSGQWSVIHDLLVGAMDKVYDPRSESFAQDNAEGSDDRKMLPLFSQWLRDQEMENVTQSKEMNVTSSRKMRTHSPFYAQFYNFNQHYPYVTDKKLNEHRCFSSLRTTDKFLRGLFEILNNTGRLENTVIVGSGDHGEDPFKSLYVRLSAFNSNILHTASYIYYPKKLMRDAGVGPRLRRNTQQLTHTLDLVPTIQSILHGGDDYWLYKKHEGCVTGLDLTAVDIPDERVTLASNFVSSLTLRRPMRLRALSTKEFTLYHRYGMNEIAAIRQGKNNAYLLRFGNCTKDTSNFCSEDLDEDGKEYFRQALQSLKNSTLIGTEVKTSELVNFFTEMVEG